jgi:hypothetical protein
MLTPAFNLQKWIDGYRHLLKPPVGTTHQDDRDEACGEWVIPAL